MLTRNHVPMGKLTVSTHVVNTGENEH